MKIGILTFWQSTDNYGQILQAYALQKYLREIGHEPYLIRYKFIGRKLSTPVWKSIAKIMFIYPYINMKYKKLKRQKYVNVLNKKNKIRDFESFKNKYIILSQYEYKSLKELKKNPPAGDCYIVGSDQVWAQELNQKENEVFFLNFGDKRIKRISYAASFSMSKYPEKLKIKLKKQLLKFNAISVREKDGINICKDIGYDAIQVADPTLLLEKKDYLHMLSSTNNNSNYMYIYSLNISDPNDIKFDDFKLYAKSNNIGIIITPSSGYILGKEIYGNNENYDYPTINKWLSNIYYSQMVVTTSFHGIIFSIILQKQFIYVPLKGIYEQGNNRALDLLLKFHLQDRVLDNRSNINYYFKHKIKWDKVYKEQILFKQESIKFLNDNL